MNDAIANLIGRADLVGIPVDPYGGTSGMAQVGAVGAPTSLMAGGVFEGRVTAGVLMAMLFGVAAFYVWTRGVQA